MTSDPHASTVFGLNASQTEGLLFATRELAEQAAAVLGGNPKIVEHTLVSYLPTQTTKWYVERGATNKDIRVRGITMWDLWFNGDGWHDTPEQAVAAHRQNETHGEHAPAL